MNYDSEFLFYCVNVHQYPNTYLLCRIADIDQKMYVILIYHSPHIYLKMNLSTRLFVSLFIPKSIFKVLS